MAAVLIPLAHLKSWEKGKVAILKLCQTFVADETAETHGSDVESNFTQVFYELISYVVHGQIGHDEVVALLTEIVNDEDKRSILVDVINIMDVDVQFTEKLKQDRFTTFVSSLVNTSVVSEDLLKERIDVESLDSLGLIQSAKGFNTKFVKIKTKLFYKQQKFNLLREESEGYSKLITELGQEMDTANHAAFLENIKSLIGRFNLDPNRVLDIMLDAFEFHLEEEDFFITLLKEYSSNYDKSTVCHILGFKYQFYKDQPDVRPPHALLYLTALLIKHDLLELDSIYLHLSPSDGEIYEDNTQELLDAKQEAKKLNAAILTSDTTNNDENKENDKEIKVEHRTFNQKFGLCHTLLLVGAWPQAKDAMDKLPKFAAVSEEPVVVAMCKLIHILIEPIYRQCSSKAARGRPYPCKLTKGPSQCKVFSDLTDCVFPLLFHLGPNLSFDPILMAKVIRVGRAFLKENPNVVLGQDRDTKLLAVWNSLTELVDQVLFPSLSLLECNPSIAEEVWILLKAFPYNIRYCLYGRWKNQSYNMHPRLIEVKAKTIKKAKYIAKRLSKENVKQSGRQIGKLSHSNPGVLFEYILSQIQKYDNFIGPVVDSLKYLTPMSYDVLAYCIIEALANPEKERLKLDDTNISEWLKSLAIFCGTVFKKYSIELTGLLQYVANQLKAGKSSDLLVLREVVQKMSGIEISEEVTMDQIEALSGGEMLRAEGGWFGQIRNTKKSSQRLRDTLMDGDLAFPLCILMAQQRNSVIFFDESSNRHLKLVGKLYDQCHDTMVQFGGFLANQLNSEDYDNNLPPLEDLVKNFYLSQDAAFFLARPMFANKIQATFEETQKNEKSRSLSQKQIFKLYISAVNSVLEPVTGNVIDLHPLRVWNNISPHLYVAFWSLTMYDLHVPVERYEAEKNKMNDLLNNLDENKELNSASKKKKEKDRCLGAIDKLKEEQKEQEQHTQRIKEWLKHEQDNWIPSKSSKNESVTQLLQLCIFPRCVFTASDAIFCAKFVHMLHNLKTPNFSTLLCFDRVFSDISYTVTTLTESEASRYGRFLSSMLEIVVRWHKDKKTYEKECGGYPGFVTVLRTTNTDKAEHLDYENFRHVCHKWQYKLTKALVVCLESKDYTQIRNTIMVLIKILPHYPKVSNLGLALERRVERICEEEKDKRKDLYALAIGYAGKLRTHKSEMIPEGMFHKKAPDAKDKANANTTPNAPQNASNANSQPDIKQEVDGNGGDSQEKHEKQVNHDGKTKTSDTAEVNDVEESKSTIKQSSSQSIATEKTSSNSVKKTSSSNGVKVSTSLTTKKSSSNVASNDVSVKPKTESSKSMSASNKSKELKETDREKQAAKESDKARNYDKAEKSKRPSPNDSPRDDYDKETKRRKMEKSDGRNSSPSSKESTPVDGSLSKSREERSKSKEKDRDKEKSHKSDRKRTSDVVEIKEVKKRKEDDDASPMRKSVQLVDEKPKEKEKQEEKTKTTIIKLSRKTEEDGVKKEKERDKNKEKEKDKHKDKTKVKEKDKEKEKDKDKDKEKEKKKKSEEKSQSNKKEPKSKDKEAKDEEKSQKKQHSHSESRRSR